MKPADKIEGQTDAYAEFVSLFSNHSRRLYGYTITLVPNWADADDVFQEASKVLWQKFDQFTSGTDFFAWACRIVHFQALYFRQQQQRSKLQFSSEFLEAVSLQSLQDIELLEQQHRALADCLKRLPPRSREIVELRYRPDATTQSVAQQLGRSLEAVYKALNRAQRVLMDCMERTIRNEEVEL
jgi:RNA polymerase sigma-70 factor, ECF subfamily